MWQSSREALLGMTPLACRNRGILTQRDALWTAVPRAECARHTRTYRFVWRSFARRVRIARYLFVPARMVAFGRRLRHIAANHGAKRSAFREDAHVDVDQEEPDREQCCRRMNQHGDIPQETETPRDVFGEPQNGAGKQEQQTAPEKAPE